MLRKNLGHSPPHWKKKLKLSNTFTPKLQWWKSNHVVSENKIEVKKKIIQLLFTKDGDSASILKQQKNIKCKYYVTKEVRCSMMHSFLVKIL